MSLINIEYGALASSETLNKNYTYLNEKITNSVDSLNTSISSLLSNIASINVKLNDISDELNDAIVNFSSEINGLRNKIQVAINTASLLPNWNGCFSINDLNNYIAEHNGFLILNSGNELEQNITINNTDITIKGYMILPIRLGDVIKTSAVFEGISFLPFSQVVINED